MAVCVCWCFLWLFFPPALRPLFLSLRTITLRVGGGRGEPSEQVPSGEYNKWVVVHTYTLCTRRERSEAGALVIYCRRGGARTCFSSFSVSFRVCVCVFRGRGREEKEEEEEEEKRSCERQESFPTHYPTYLCIIESKPRAVTRGRRQC